MVRYIYKRAYMSKFVAYQTTFYYELVGIKEIMTIEGSINISSCTEFNQVLTFRKKGVDWASEQSCGKSKASVILKWYNHLQASKHFFMNFFFEEAFYLIDKLN